MDVAGDITKSPKALNELSNATEVICVEDWRKANYTEVVNEIEMVQSTGKKVLGIVFIN